MPSWHLHRYRDPKPWPHIHTANILPNELFSQPKGKISLIIYLFSSLCRFTLMSAVALEDQKRVSDSPLSYRLL